MDNEEKLILKRKKHIKEYVEGWMKGHEPDTFIPNEQGMFMYKSGSSTINLKYYFEQLIDDYIDDQST